MGCEVGSRKLFPPVPHPSAGGNDNHLSQTPHSEKQSTQTFLSSFFIFVCRLSPETFHGQRDKELPKNSLRLSSWVLKSVMQILSFGICPMTEVTSAKFL